MCCLQALNRDVLAEILGRFDGSTLAAVACTCSDLRDTARDQHLWRRLCQSTWPSTTLEEAQHLLTASPIGSFHRYYANSYPLLLPGKPIKDNDPKPLKRPEVKTHISAAQFASLVDVYYGGQCVLSKVLDGIPLEVDTNDDKDGECNYSEDSRRWYSNCPFNLELLSPNYDEGMGFNNEDNMNEDHVHNADDEERRVPPSISGGEDGKLRHDHCKELEEKLRLSWVLLDKKNGRTVNLSSWKPIFVESRWAFSGNYVIHFASVVTVDESLPAQKLAVCKILVRCKMIGEGCPQWREISMHIEDITGASVNGSRSLMVLDHALGCSRSINRLEFKRGFRQYEKQKKEIMRKKELQEALVGGFWVSIEVAVFVTFCYIFVFH